MPDSRHTTSPYTQRFIGSRGRQYGMTTLGMLILVAFIGLFVFAGIRLAPVYLEHMKIVSVLDGVKAEYSGQNPSRDDIKRSLSRRFDVESINIISDKDVKIRKVADGYVLEAAYENRTPFIANISFAVTFDKKVDVRS
ncbi:MAG: DUF4845 domain-containing protein [Gammaproteobacteria bacterium]